MPCSDSSSSIVIKLDRAERFAAFEYAKITCGREIQAKTGLQEYYKGLSLTQILEIPFTQIQTDLETKEDEALFILYMEWDALRSAIGQYLGIDNDEIDIERCKISSIDSTEEGVEIAQVILPPKELPKILPCRLAEKT